MQSFVYQRKNCNQNNDIRQDNTTVCYQRKRKHAMPFYATLPFFIHTKFTLNYVIFVTVLLIRMPIALSMNRINRSNNHFKSSISVRNVTIRLEIFEFTMQFKLKGTDRCLTRVMPVVFTVRFFFLCPFCSILYE